MFKKKTNGSKLIRSYFEFFFFQSFAPLCSETQDMKKIERTFFFLDILFQNPRFDWFGGKIYKRVKHKGKHKKFLRKKQIKTA